MDRVIELLQEKNQCLQRFYLMTEREMPNFVNGDFDNLEKFYSNREALLELIQKIDELVERSHELQGEGIEITQQTKDVVEKVLREKNDLTHRILQQDMEVLSIIDGGQELSLRYIVPCP